MYAGTTYMKAYAGILHGLIDDWSLNHMNHQGTPQGRSFETWHRDAIETKRSKPHRTTSSNVSSELLFRKGGVPCPISGVLRAAQDATHDNKPMSHQSPRASRPYEKHT